MRSAYRVLLIPIQTLAFSKSLQLIRFAVTAPGMASANRLTMRVFRQAVAAQDVP